MSFEGGLSLAGIFRAGVRGRRRASGIAVPVAALCLALGLGACSSNTALQTFDLNAPREGIAAGRGRGLLVVAEPQALQALDSDRIIVMTSQGGIAYLPGAQWSDRLPKLLQSRLIQTFENGRRIRAIGRPGDRLVPAAQLNSEIRAFGIDEKTGDAFIEVSVKIVSDRVGRILHGEVFSARVPAGGATSGPAAVAALDLASQQLLREIVRWVSARI